MTLDELFNELLRVKPRGWSVTRAGRSLCVRPPDRTLCKFQLGLLKNGSLAVGRFDRVLNHWTGHEHIEPSFISAAAVFDHLKRRVTRDK